jgi:hypothetical protein
MESSSDPAVDQAADPLTFGDLCYAIEQGRVGAERRGASFELRQRDALLWARREIAFRTLLAPLADRLTLDLFDVGGCA